MRGFLMRFWFLITLLFMTIIGYVCFGIAKPKLLWFLTPENAEWFSVSIRQPVMFALSGICIISVTIFIFMILSTKGTFSIKVLKPKEVNRMIAQGKAVFLVDKKVYVTENAHLYNLNNLDRIRKVYKYNFFYIRIYDDLEIADEEKPEVKLNQLLEDDGFKNPIIEGDLNEKGEDQQ